MSPFTRVTGPAAPLPRDNVDTDVIIRVERLAALDRDQLGPYALEALRLRPDGSEDPAFILNQPPFRSAPILLAGANFGCGSSREAAVWALMGRGIRCVIAPSFGDIFFSNCFQNGLLPIRLPLGRVQAIATAAAAGAPFTVDLQQCTISSPSGEVIPFEIDAQKREALLLGLDEIQLTLRDDESIRAWQHEDQDHRPWAWLSHPAPRPSRA
ncbi:3-isopropylmalate dehydratase small subunit [Ramlibacter henchirensis]|uniref:3-isopropylmalate dehydratase small subunit n=1 Tax=Ramlibacter henchirensis TaxID=204072 RepID=A0A4Z0BVK0_9BURK|nr:3-isopropylmalate dehydratase small subunit [Ramlibacter henchirensis]TFZ02901.1 3-isopropylmalate dehydratase small subunit [Ramlibacter henchirensis]